MNENEKISCNNDDHKSKNTNTKLLYKNESLPFPEDLTAWRPHLMMWAPACQQGGAPSGGHRSFTKRNMDTWSFVWKSFKICIFNILQIGVQAAGIIESLLLLCRCGLSAGQGYISEVSAFSKSLQCSSCRFFVLPVPVISDQEVCELKMNGREVIVNQQSTRD